MMDDGLVFGFSYYVLVIIMINTNISSWTMMIDWIITVSSWGFTLDHSPFGEFTISEKIEKIEDIHQARRPLTALWIGSNHEIDKQLAFGMRVKHGNPYKIHEIHGHHRDSFCYFT